MKLLSLFIGAVSASSLVRRDLATIQGVLSGVSNQVDALNAAVTAFSGDPTQLTAASASLLQTINAGVGTVQGTGAISDNDAIQLATSVTTLNSSVAAVVDNLISKSAAFSAACVVPTVVQDLNDQKTASTNLAAAITQKVPTSFQDLAAQLSGDIANNLQRGLNAYAGVSNAPTCSSTGAPPPPTSTEAPPPGSSSPPPPGSSAPSSSAPGSSSGSESAPPTYPTSSAPAPPTYPSNSIGLPPPGSSYPVPPSYPSSSVPSLPSSAPSYPSDVPSYPSGPSDTPSYPSESSPATPVYPTYTKSATYSSPPAQQTVNAAVVNQVGGPLALVAGIAALLV